MSISPLFLSLLLSLITLLGASSSFAAPDYQDGDLIFHQSKSAQSKAIHEATGSPWSHVGVLFEDRGTWYVAEATQPVRIVTLKSFIPRGRGNHYRTYRLPGITATQKQVLRDEIGKMIGGDYDLYFEWSDDLIYCSELVFKAFVTATGVELGTLQKFKDLKIDGPYVKELIRRRIQNTGRTLNLEEPIVTPVSQMLDSNLKLIIQTGP
jgi:hypothetical protein